MGRRTILFAQLSVVPTMYPDPENEGEMLEGKQLVFTDEEAGEIILYPMGDEHAKKTGRRLKMSNKALAGELEDEARRAQARQQVLGSNGGPLPPEARKAAEDILNGVHIKEGGEEG